MEIPLGIVEPHKELLKTPAPGKIIYKVMKIESLLSSINDSYLYFNRVDSYRDFPGADQFDGKQLPKDQSGNENTKFKGNLDFTAAHYYDQFRSRTYACCFSLENSDYIWRNYANGSEKGKVCLAFDFDKLRETLSQSLQQGNSAVTYSGLRCRQIFSINYGVVEYVKWHEHQLNEEFLPNPILYIYVKDRDGYAEEKELRISLSAFGMGKFILNDGSEMKFPSGLQLEFDFRTAIGNGTIKEILYPPDFDSSYLREELSKLQIVGK